MRFHVATNFANYEEVQRLSLDNPSTSFVTHQAIATQRSPLLGTLSACNLGRPAESSSVTLERRIIYTEY